MEIPIRMNEGKVDWTLLPWDENMIYFIAEEVQRLEVYKDIVRRELLLKELVSGKDVIQILSLALLLQDNTYTNKEGTFDVSNLPYDALEQVCRVFAYGATKYQRDNYKIAPGLPLEGYIQSIWRHTVSYLKGDLLDEDSKLPNLAHIACNCFMYLWTEKKYHNDSK